MSGFNFIKIVSSLGFNELEKQGEDRDPKRSLNILYGIFNLTFSNF